MANVSFGSIKETAIEKTSQVVNNNKMNIFIYINMALYALLLWCLILKYS